MHKNILLIISVLSIATCLRAQEYVDSVYIKGYAIDLNGLRFAYCRDAPADVAIDTPLHVSTAADWIPVGNGFVFLNSDYGPWGSEKHLSNPHLWRDAEGLWHCIFDANEKDDVKGVATSRDLIHWLPQNYHVSRDKQPADSVFRVPWSFVENLINHTKTVAYNNMLYAETAANMEAEFPKETDVVVKIKPDFANTKKISDKLIGVFFEDINYAADGGLYAELLQNRDFEYSARDRQEWNATTAWRYNVETGHASSPQPAISLQTTPNANILIDTVNPLSENNPHYAVLSDGQTIVNEGFDGIPLRKGDKYDFSFFARADKAAQIVVKLTDSKGNALSNTLTFKVASKTWRQYRGVLTATATDANALLDCFVPRNDGNVPCRHCEHSESISSTVRNTVCVDMLSLFPQKTFKQRKNGLRADLAQAIADIKPKFVRFPGGCVAHGNGLENIYLWKESIGSLEQRKPDFNIWGYHQTKGLGYFEYFQFCEDIGAEPLPILAAGVPCQNSRANTETLQNKAKMLPPAGQQGGIPLEDMDAYIQDILDLIEWANGSPQTAWGRKRAEAGHPKPFNLKYIGIGNEDLISEVFKERFTLIYNAIKAKHPEIKIIGTVGPFYEGADYDEGWRFATQLGVPLVDEHYYVSPAWMLYNQHFYDRYSRSKPKVYLGEYAAHLPGRPNNVETALTEALHLCNVERNADVVEMTSYAPLLAKNAHTQWNPDLIYFNNTEVMPTVGYYVQQLFGANAGDEYVPSSLEISSPNEKLRARIARSIVHDNASGDLIIRLVNILPNSVKVDFEDFKLQGRQITKTTLQGAPDSRTAVPVSETIELQDDTIILPPYSFVLLRIATR